MNLSPLPSSLFFFFIINFLSRPSILFLSPHLNKTVTVFKKTCLHCIERSDGSGRIVIRKSRRNRRLRINFKRMGLILRFFLTSLLPWRILNYSQSGDWKLSEVPNQMSIPSRRDQPPPKAPFHPPLQLQKARAQGPRAFASLLPKPPTPSHRFISATPLGSSFSGMLLVVPAQLGALIVAIAPDGACRRGACCGSGCRRLHYGIFLLGLLSFVLKRVFWWLFSEVILC